MTLEVEFGIGILMFGQMFGIGILMFGKMILFIMFRKIEKELKKLNNKLDKLAGPKLTEEKGK